MVCHVAFVIFMSGCCSSQKMLSSVVVLTALGRIAFNQGRYEESLQMYGREHDILMTTSPKSEELATGRQ